MIMLDENNDISLFEQGDADTSQLTVVVPVYNEEDCLPDFHERLSRTLQNAPIDSEILYIDDGSTDHSFHLLRGFQKSDSVKVSILQLSRNFGKEVAMSAGLNHADGDAVVLIDADLQDPPELIINMLLEWRRGYDMVCMRRRGRDNEGLVKRATARFFYRIMSLLSSIKIQADVGDFRLLSRRAVTTLRQFPERDRFMKGLFSWVGFKTITLDYDRSSRTRGKTKFNLRQLTMLAFDGITSFSITPLRLSSYTGFLVSLFAFLFGSYIVVKAIILGDPVAGFPTLLAILTFLGGMQLLAIGLLGEYVGRIYIETKFRPLYVVDSYIPGKNAIDLTMKNYKSSEFQAPVHTQKVP